MEVRAPFAGEIVERMAVRGALVEAGKPLFTLVDHSTVWAMLQVPEATLARVKIGPGGGTAGGFAAGQGVHRQADVDWPGGG